MMDDVCRIISSKSPFCGECQETFENTLDYLNKEVRVLAVGAGGLGCEILKCLPYCGFKSITVVDMDTIDVSNLNRQFLFRSVDVGRPKAEVAAEFVNKRCAHLGVKVESRVCKIQDLEMSFFSRFMIIIAGLDNIEARRWLNSTVHALVQKDADGGVDKSSLRFFLDGGTEGLKGQARVIVPTMTACFECTLETFPRVTTTYPLCTIAETPRLPEHCIEYAMAVLFEMEFPNRDFDGDNEKDIEWVFQKALQRAKDYKISGEVSKELTKGVVKRIIPAVASTNALIAGVLVNEAFKIATYASPVMDNYWMYMGQTGINSQKISYERKPDCVVCDQEDVCICFQSLESTTLEDVLNDLTQKLRFKTHPSLSCISSGNVIYMRNPESLRVQLEPRLRMFLSQLRDTGILVGTSLLVTAPELSRPFTVRLKLIS